MDGEVNISWHDFNLLSKYLYNKVDKGEFHSILTEGLGHELDEGYVDEKWIAFQRNQMGFIAGYDECVYDIIIRDMKETGYPG